ncbi:hypothetical protein ABQE48_03780 [Mycolicibacterium thermoresistibile]
MATTPSTLLAPAAAALTVFAGAVVLVPAHAQPLPYGPDTCIQGFVWREARPGDTVCVTPAVRTRTAQENANAAQNREPGGGAYGPDTCKQGFVWREAFPGDTVCVTPAVRSEAAADNAAAGSRKQANAPAPAAPAAPPRNPICDFNIPFAPGC